MSDDGGFEDGFGDDEGGFEDGFGDDDDGFGGDDAFDTEDIVISESMDDDFGFISSDASSDTFNWMKEDCAELEAWISKYYNFCNDGRQKAAVYPDATNRVRVRIAVSTGFIDKWTAQAWKVNNAIPIIIELLFETKKYVESVKPPSVEVWQSADFMLNDHTLNDKQSFGLKWFLEDRIRNAIKHSWNSRSSYLRKSQSLKLSLGLSRSSSTVSKSKSKKEKKSKKSSKTKTTTAIVDTIQTTEREAIESLKAMGVNFNDEILLKAIRKTKMDINLAANLLFDEGEAAVLGKDEEAYIGLQDNASGEIRKEGWAKVKDDDFLFNNERNFLIQLYELTSWRINTCGDVCTICDDPLLNPGLKPAVCEKQICQHSQDTYGLGVSLVGELRYNKLVIDVLVSITMAAAKNKRSNNVDVFEPYPHNLSIVSNDIVYSFKKKNGEKDTALLAQVGDMLPSVKTMANYPTDRELKAYLDSLHPLCCPLLQWIITSNPSHISPVPADKHIKDMQTPHQFVLVSDSPQKDMFIRSQRKQYGSFYAFHGSGCMNWHAILRVGLKNYSNTDKMSAGAAYGPGIYLAANASTSFSYMSCGTSWKNSCIGKNISCISLCEIVDRRAGQKGTNGVCDFTSIYTVQDEKILTTRYFFLYTDNKHNSVDAAKLKLPTDIYE